VERVAVLRIAEPLRRAALPRFELRLAPQAGWLNRSGGDQRRVPVHNVLLNLRQPASGGIVPDCGKAVSGLPPLHRDDLTQVTRVTISPVGVGSVRGAPRSIRSAVGNAPPPTSGASAGCGERRARRAPRPVKPTHSTSGPLHIQR